MTINAVETYHAGHLFRSRLEARWATVFDDLGIRWEYEPQGYRVGEQRRPYLPDFYLTDLGWWVEVKGERTRLDVSLMLDAVHPTLGLGRTDPFYRTNMLILGDIPRREDFVYAHFSITRSAVLGSTVMDCKGACHFTGPLFGLHYFAPVPDALPDIVLEQLGVKVADYERLRQLGAILQQGGRQWTRQPHLDLTEAMPLPGLRQRLPRLEAAYTLGRTARFEHGAAA